eukprot:TRINITY_DN247_c0_g1_i1.p2 TRINITY_DN247_c0_g1~~TRINITY_DN247_c0_g1_i1.p2  ORF type:complete len:287 (+),score=89.86 TRINITY_DN247_c0_g1_i1:564-1424(+)
METTTEHEKPDHGICDEATALQVANEGAQLCEEGDYEGAVSKLSAALTKLTELHGEASPKLAAIYLEYGIALLREHQATQDILNPDAAVLEEEEKKTSDAEGGDEEKEGTFEKLMEENPLCLAYSVVTAAKEHFKTMPDRVDRYILCHNVLGEILHEMNNFELSAACYAEAVQLLTDPADELKKATALGCQAMALRYGEKIPEAKEVCERALAILKKDETANADRIGAIQALLEDCDTDFNQVHEEAKNATIGTHSVGTSSKPSNAPVNVLQPRKKRKVDETKPTA